MDETTDRIYYSQEEQTVGGFLSTQDSRRPNRDQ
jgi:hypothetical protein